MTQTRQQESKPLALPNLNLVRSIGAGGFGEVWLARHGTLDDRLRAVKIVRRDAFPSGAAFREEFKGLQLYQELSRDSQHLVSIYQVGHQDRFYYYEMDLADDRGTARPCGEDEKAISAYAPMTLSARVGRGAPRFLRVTECLCLGCDLAEALEGLHDEGLIHRDVKPDNILFINGVPCLADIGAMTRGEDRGSVVALGYTPPEGAGQPRSDVFSLGRTLFFASSGSDPLYQLGSYPEAYYEQEWRDRKRLEQVIDRASRQAPKARYPSMHAMRGELESFAPTRERRPFKGWWMGGVSVLGVLGTVGGLAWYGAPPFARDEAIASPRVAPVRPDPVEDGKETRPPRERLLRVLVVSRTGRDVPGAELCLGMESHAVNWNDDPDRWLPASQTISARTKTPLFVSVRAPGYTPRDVEVFSVEESVSEDMPHLVNVALAAKPGSLRRPDPWRVFERGHRPLGVRGKRSSCSRRRAHSPP